MLMHRLRLSPISNARCRNVCRTILNRSPDNHFVKKNGGENEIAKMGNGQKAQHKRERAKNDAKKGPTSQLKTNEAAKNIVCQVCRNTFLCTVRKKALEEHADNKHGKKLEECFPGFVETAGKK
ncbi:unnamed protein product [Rhizophagus irregularis]|nr:unnamed protein product [Rhizophagus irregularis]CAB4409484.1 unnamed protein product [Rhizophagus irregularis]